jgi:hypothetical protein
LLQGLVAFRVEAAPEPGTRLHYLVLSGKTEVPPPFASVDIIYGPRENGARWSQMEIRAQAAVTNAPYCTIRGLTATDPLSDKASAWDFLRYQLRTSETNHPLEYVDVHSGKALLPPWADFEKLFVPHAALGTRYHKGAPQTCELLGQILTLDSASPGEWPKWPEPKRLVLDREVLIGSSRNFKDAEGHRLPQTPQPKEYTYVPFNADDYRSMINAGMNLFTIGADQQQWVQDEPAFYTRLTTGDPPVRYPADLYRANYLGTAMFMDEPASVVTWDNTRGALFAHFADVTSLIEKRTRAMFYSGDLNYGVYGTEKALGVNFGDMRLAQTELPVWETQYDRTYYLMLGGGTGIIHEGRYQLKDFNEKVARLADGDCQFNSREMLEYYYAWLRGGTRPFGKFWGTAIYGQCDPAIAPESFTLAYDMGARYFWFWSSDHGHHVPWLEQLELTRQLKSYVDAHPRRSIYLPQPKRDRAITIPKGWFVSLEDPVWMRGFDKDGKSGESAVYRELQRKTLRATHESFKRGESLDITIDDGHRITGYRHVEKIKE